MADDPLSATLSEIRAGLEAAALAFGPPPLDAARASYAAGTLHGNALKALAGIEEALRFHRPRQLHELAFTPGGSPRCGHDPNTDPDAHYEGDDGEWRCEDLPAGTTCSGCPGRPDGEYADWPCDEYTAILAALTGEAPGG